MKYMRKIYTTRIGPKNKFVKLAGSLNISLKVENFFSSERFFSYFIFQKKKEKESLNKKLKIYQFHFHLTVLNICSFGTFCNNFLCSIALFFLVRVCNFYVTIKPVLMIKS